LYKVVFNLNRGVCSEKRIFKVRIFSNL